MSLSMERALPAPAEQTAGGLRELVALALPVVLTSLSSTLMMTADAAIVGRLGATQLGAVGYGGIWFWTALSVFGGTASGVQTFVAQAHGAGEPRRCGAWVWHALYAVVPAAVLGMTAFALAFGPLIGLLSPAPGLQPLAMTYVHARAFGVVGFTVSWVLAGFFRGIGDTRTPLYAVIAANLVNLFFNIGLVFGHFGLPQWGVFGSGAATAIAESVYALLLLLAFRRRAVDARFGTAPCRVDADAVRRFLRTGAPIGGQWALDMLAFAIFSTLVARMGEAQMAASQAMISLMHLSFMQVLGIAVAVSTLVGRYVGARDLVAAARSHHTGMRLGVALAAGVGGAFLLFPNTCLRLFTSDDRVLTLAGPLLAVGALFQVCDAAGVLAGGALRGAGDTRWPFLVQTALAWGVFLPAGYVGGIMLGGGLRGAWLGGVLYVAALAVALQWRFRGGAWKQVRI